MSTENNFLQYVDFNTIDKFKPMKSCFVHKVNDRNVAISDIEQVKCYESEYSVYVTCLFPDFEDNQIFDHENDHCSLLHLVEGCRQMSLAIPHKFYNIPFEGYCNFLKHINLKLDYFVEKSSPIALVCKVNLRRQSSNLLDMGLHFAYCQDGIEKTYVDGDTQVVSKSLYKKIRGANLVEQ